MYGWYQLYQILRELTAWYKYRFIGFATCARRSLAYHTAIHIIIYSSL